MAWDRLMVSPLFSLYVETGDRGIRRLWFDTPAVPEGSRDPTHPLIRDTARQLAEYFERRRRTFDLPLQLEGTDFQLRVWNALVRIPYGETRSYGQFATSLGDGGAARAIGAANGSNPVAIIVPCHRVIGAGGRLGGYGGGLERKRFLLDLESGVSASLLATAGE